MKIKILTIILNRVYAFLSLKTKNQAPFSGAVLLVTLLFFVSIRDVFLFLFVFKTEAWKTDYRINWIVGIIVFVLVYLYAKKNRRLIEQTDLHSSASKNITVAFFFIFTTVIFIFLANINRKKIFNDPKIIEPPRKESLEGKIRKWFE